MRSLIAVLFVLGCAAAMASASPQQALGPEATGAAAAGGVSVDRVRKALAEEYAGRTLVETIDGVPTFKVTILGDRPFLREFKSTLDQKWQPIQPGMLYHNEFITMVTPFQARPYGAFADAELLRVMADTMKNHYLQEAIVTAVKMLGKAVRRAEEARIRREVQEELRTFERAKAQADQASKR